VKKKIELILDSVGLYKPIRFIYNKVSRLNKKTSITFLENKYSFWTPTFYLNDYVNNFGGEKNLIKLILSKLRAGDIVWDVGANIGFHSVVLAKTSANKDIEVYSFEPERKTFNLLMKNISLNELNNVYAFNLALGENNYLRDIYSSDTPNFGAHSFVQRTDYKVKKRGNKVNVVSGDNLVTENNLKVPSVIKIDVEGAEILVLKGLKKTLRNKDVRLIFLEAHINLLPKFNSSIEELLEIIRENGFKFSEKTNRDQQEQYIFER
jgi:FkbM family methyltransferase